MHRTILPDGEKTVDRGGDKWLAEKIIDKIQNHFGEAIPKNSRNLESVQRMFPFYIP